MDSDQAKDAVLQYLYEQQMKHPTRHMGYPKAHIIVRLTRHNSFDKGALSLAVDYLEDEGYLKTQTQQHVKYYRLSAKAQDKFLAPSAYAKQSGDNFRVFNNGGVLVMGNVYGDISIEARQQASELLNELTKEVGKRTDLKEEEKIDLVESANTIQAQINRPVPDKSIVKKAWGTLKGAATVDGVMSLAQRLTPFITNLLN